MLPYAYETNARNRATLITVVTVWVALTFALFMLDAAPWLMAVLGAFTLPALYDYLMRRRIMPVGRYGTWNYMGMEDSILHGIQAAGFLKSRAAAGG